MLKTNKKALILYILIALVLIVISLIIRFIFNSYEALIVLSLTSVCSFFTLLINFRLGKNKENASTTSFMMISLLRVLTIFIGLIASAVIIYFLDKDNTDKYRFMYLMLGLIPIFVSNLIFYLRSLHE